MNRRPSNMKITIPDNIKKWTERIAEEYKQVYEDICEARATTKKINEETYWKMEVGDLTYVNAECYLFLSQAVQQFREEMDEQNTELFQDCDEDTLKRRIIFRIKEYAEYLPAENYSRADKDVICDEKLTKVLNQKRFPKGVKKEVEELLYFISQRKTGSWSAEDQDIKRAIFKYVESEEKLLELLEDQENIELTPGYRKAFKEIRVVYHEKSKKELYEERGVLKQYQEFLQKNLWNGHLPNELEVFDKWNDIKWTGVYYVFIPKMKK